MKGLLILFVISFLSTINFLSAEIIRGIDISFATIENPGNPGDTRATASPQKCGAVNYTYKIGKYEITQDQWQTFSIAAGEPFGNPRTPYDEDAYWTGYKIPTNNISWLEAAQFCNYLTSGNKFKGAYVFTGSVYNGIDRQTAISTYGTVYAIPTQDEWYKAAYYTGSGYSTYANGTNTAPIAGVNANYNRALGIGVPWQVGSGTQEQNGTYDMMGNVWEWTETVVGTERIFRGGGYYYPVDHLKSSAYNDAALDYENIDFGFRIIEIPEPAALILLGIGSLLFTKRKQQYSCK